jgi:phosphoglycerate dehydrogenase-like enzyme
VCVPIVFRLAISYSSSKLQSVNRKKRVKICRMIEYIQTIGVVGLGRMGTAIANNILKSGFNLVVYDRTPDRTRSLVEAGAATATSPRQAGMRSDVLVTSLTDDRAVLDLVTGEEGILSGLKPSTIHIGTSTISPSVSTQLGEMRALQHYRNMPRESGQKIFIM